MQTFPDAFTPREQARLSAIAVWYQLLENRQLRMDCPDDYHAELARQADEMDRLGIISFAEWRGLRDEAHRAYQHAVQGVDYEHEERVTDG